MAEKIVDPYLRDSVLTATPEQLQLMLYDGAIRFAAKAIESLRRKDYEGSYNGFSRAQQIVLEMLNGLNREVNPKLCDRMASIYHFIHGKLVDACVRKDEQAAEDALKVLRFERETWRMLVEKVNRIREGTDGDQYESAEASASTEPGGGGSAGHIPISFQTEA